MRELTEREEIAFKNAVTNHAYDRALFERAVKVLRYCKALTPEGITYNMDDWPTRVYDWRRRSEWALDLLKRHQAAAKASDIEFWRVFLLTNKE